MLSILIVLIFFSDNFNCLTLHLSVEENTKPSNPIGNLQYILKNQTKIWNKFEFKSFQFADKNYESFETKNLIKVDPRNGDIWLQVAIDREEICQPLNNCEGKTFLDYLVYIDKIIFQLKIEIIDINDNSPLFNPDDKQIEIPEGIATSTMYSLPVAKDKDSVEYGIKIYLLKPIRNNDYEKYFQLIINPETKYPLLKIINELDRESKDIFEFYIYAIDGGDNQGKCRITVKITDINDNTPQWIGLPYRKQIRECTTDNKVKHLMAQDRDNPLTEGGQIRFRISDNSPNTDIVSRTFYITDNTLFLNKGTLQLLGQKKLYVFVIAIDGGGRSNETTVEVEILDCNDHAPVIHVDTPMPTVDENDHSVKILSRIDVKDQDYGINSEFNCHLNDSSHLVLIPTYVMDSQTSKNRMKIFELHTILEMGFDREKTARHSVKIICIDNGQPVMSSSTIITVLVIDQNDNRPKFEVEFKIFSISEDAKIGSEIGRVIATDDDVNPNNVISYFIIGEEEVRNTFSITNQGQIQLYLSIDREKIEKYDFKIVAVDSGKPSLNDSCKIRVLVLDVNDCKPEIAKKHHFSIVESYGTEIKHINLGKLNATDKDNGYNGTITFRLKSTNPNLSPIKVLSDGRLSIYGMIDREKSERIEVDIQVIDGGNPPQISLTTVIVDILDLNDNKPTFKFPSARYNNFINVSWDLSLGSIIGQLQATDPDKDLNGTIEFNLVGSNAQKKMFNIHSDGQIMLNEKLNRYQKQSIKMMVEAKDRGTPPLKEITTLYIKFLSSKNENMDNKIISYPKWDKKEKKLDLMGFSNVMILIYSLIAAVFIIILGIGGSFLYFWCRGQWICPLEDSDKHESVRELNSPGYHKNSSKFAKNLSLQSTLEINNQFSRPKNDTSYKIIDPQSQVVNYSSLVKNCAGRGHTDQPYQFRTGIHGGNYSAFHPQKESPENEKGIQELCHFNNEMLWNHPNQINTIDICNRTKSEEVDNMYDSHKYNVPSNFDGSHFSTPNQARQLDFIQSRNDPIYKAKINSFASSFV